MEKNLLIIWSAMALTACKKDKTETPAASFPQTIIPVIPVPHNPASAWVTGQIVPLDIVSPSSCT